MPATELAPTMTLDLKGLLCPMPVVKIATAVKKVQIGDTIEAFATDPGVLADIPAWARASGNEVLALEKRPADIRFVVKRTK